MGKLQVADINFVALVLNRNITTKKKTLYFISTLSRALACFHLSMYFIVMKQVYVFICAVNQDSANCDDELQYKHFKESR